ncbi:MAG: 23S rRNA (adenine(2503)-C(2))-methyltransferase RlmN [Calditrichaeota bacterium]|nr:23S rRNA (adenine(2503)-C(2))-methyltransferase RlmN [Calditrichota bacterium]
METEPGKRQLVGMSMEELEQFACSMGEKPFRGRQLFAWLYNKRARDFAEMTDISKPLRLRLAEVAEIGLLRVVAVVSSRDGGTRKFLFELGDGERIESVYIREAERHTLCVSTQVGCALGCRFCATGRMGFRRNLSAGEIVDQVLLVEREVGEEVSNLVLMGMGEPLLNYENVIAACELVRHERGLAIGHRRIVISTAGWVPGIMRLAEEGHRFKLAISLNATTDEQRRALMPVAERYPLQELLNAVIFYFRRSGRRPTFEYVLLAGVNDSPEDARRLRELLKQVPCKVNLIPYNPTDDHFRRPTAERIEAFRQGLAPLKAPVIVRWSKGDDIQAACGQLATSRKGEHA